MPGMDMINHSCHPRERNTKLVMQHDSTTPQRESDTPEECSTGYFAMLAGVPRNKSHYPPGVALYEVQLVALVAVQCMMCS